MSSFGDLVIRMVLIGAGLTVGFLLFDQFYNLYRDIKKESEKVRVRTILEDCHKRG